MTNIEHLRELLKNLKEKNFDVDTGGEIVNEALEFVEAIEEEFSDMKTELLEEKDSVARLTTDNEELQKQMEGYHEVNLGLDTLHYRLEQGNLLIQQKLEGALKEINQITNAETIL